MKLRIKNIALAATIVGMFTLVGCGSEEPVKKVQEENFVKVTDLKNESGFNTIRVSGFLSTKEEIMLSFKTGGVINRIAVNEGESIGAGAFVASLELSEIDAQVSQADFGVEKAKRDFERVQNLYADSVATLEQFQDAKTGYDVAKANQTIAKFNQNYSSISAPRTGIVIKKVAKENEIVGPGMPVVVLGNTSSGWVVRSGLSEREIINVKLGDKAVVHFDAYPDKSFDAVVTKVSAALTPGTGTYEVEVSIKGSGFKPLVGLFATVEIIPSIKQDYLLIPIESIAEASGDSAYVFVLNDAGNAVVRKTIKVGFIKSSSIAVLSGLTGTEKLVTAGAKNISDNASVTVVK